MFFGVSLPSQLPCSRVVSVPLGRGFEGAVERVAVALHGGDQALDPDRLGAERRHLCTARRALHLEQLAGRLPGEAHGAEAGVERTPVEVGREPRGGGHAHCGRNADLEIQRARLHRGAPLTRSRRERQLDHQKDSYTRCNDQGQQAVEHESQDLLQGTFSDHQIGFATVTACHGPWDWPLAAAQYQLEVSVKAVPRASTMRSQTRIFCAPCRCATKQRHMRSCASRSRPHLFDAVAQRAIAIGRRVQHARGLRHLAHHQGLRAVGHAADGAGEAIGKALLHVAQGQRAQRNAIPLARPFVRHHGSNRFGWCAHGRGCRPQHAQHHRQRKGCLVADAVDEMVCKPTFKERCRHGGFLGW